MSEKTTLKIMRCPTCGASLKAKNNTETITCVYCGNSVVPVAETTPVYEKPKKLLAPHAPPIVSR
mgnify:CR=1 FL=1